MQLIANNEAEFYEYSITNSRDFWRSSCEALGIVFKNNYKLTNENICDASDPKYPKWFTGAEMNIADSLMRYAKIEPNKTALIYEDELGKKKAISYKELDELSNKFANGLAEKGIKKGDYIMLCTAAMNPESIAAYIGTMKAGVISVPLSPRAEKPEFDLKLAQLPAKPKLVITQDHCNKDVNKLHPLYTKISELNIAPVVTITDSALGNLEMKKGDTDFTSFINGKSEKFGSVAMSPEDVVSVLFSSGTTGVPKAIPWRADCFIKSANDGRLHHLMNDKDILCWQSNLNWMMGSFNIASAFINGAALAVYEGNTLSKEFSKFVERNKVTKFGLTPAFAQNKDGGWQETGNLEGCDLSSVTMYMSTSSASDPENYAYMRKLLPNAHGCEYSGGTEIGGCLNTCLPYKPNGPSEFNTPAFGTRLHFIQDKDDASLVTMCVVVSNKNGYIPPMGLSKSLMNKDKDHDKEYYIFEDKDNAGKVLSEGYKVNTKGELLRKHGDSLTLISKPGKYIGDVFDIRDLRFISAGREDDIINIKGNKIGADHLEALIKNNIKGTASDAMIQDLAVFQTEPKHGNKVVYYVILKDKNASNPKDTIHKEFRDAIKKHNSLFAVIDDIVFTDSLAKLGSKVQRKAMRNAYQALTKEKLKS